MSERADPVARFFAGALMAVGGLIAALCGTCTAGFMIFSLVDAVRYSGSAANLVPALLTFLLIGGLPTLLGVLVFRAGWRRFRGPRRVTRSQIAVFGDEEDKP